MGGDFGTSRFYMMLKNLILVRKAALARQGPSENAYEALARHGSIESVSDAFARRGPSESVQKNVAQRRSIKRASKALDLHI